MQNERSGPAEPYRAGASSPDASSSTDADSGEMREVTVRRSPRYGRLMLLGAIVFVIVAAVITYSFPRHAGVDRNALFGLVGLFAAAAGVAAGGLVALLLDRAARRREGTVRLVRETVTPAADPSEPVVFPVAEPSQPDATHEDDRPGRGEGA